MKVSERKKKRGNEKKGEIYVGPVSEKDLRRQNQKNGLCFPSVNRPVKERGDKPGGVTITAKGYESERIPGGPRMALADRR